MPPFQPQALPFINREMLSFGKNVTFKLEVQLSSLTTDPIDIRGYTKDGFFTFTLEPSGSGVLDTFTLAISDVPISISVTASPTAVNISYAYVMVHLSVNDNKITLLAQGTVTRGFGISWPVPTPPTEIQMKGFFDTIEGAQPAAGAECSTTVPDFQVWEIYAIKYFLSASSSVANRTINIQIMNANDDIILWRKDATAIIAEEAVAATFIVGGTNAVILASDTHEVALPSGPLYLHASMKIKTVTDNIQSGDQYGPPIIYARRSMFLHEPS